MNNVAQNNIVNILRLREKKRERGRKGEGERERGKHQNSSISAIQKIRVHPPEKNTKIIQVPLDDFRNLVDN